MYRLATKCTTKKRSAKRHKCLWIQAIHVHGSRKGTARLSTMTHSVPWRCREQCDCRCSRGVWTADCGHRSAVIVGSADWQQTDFLFRGRDVAITMNSVKILHAVRSAITAIAELLVLFILTFCSSLNGRTIKTARVQPGRIKPWAYSRTLLSCCCGCSWAGCGNTNYADYDDRYDDHSENHDIDGNYHDNFVVIWKMRTNTRCLFANKCKVYNTRKAC